MLSRKARLYLFWMWLMKLPSRGHGSITIRWKPFPRAFGRLRLDVRVTPDQHYSLLARGILPVTPPRVRYLNSEAQPVIISREKDG